jgi:hypothetical protein
MESNNADTLHEHISLDEMEQLFSMEGDEPRLEELQLVESVDKKVAACSVCQRRYRFFVNWHATFKDSIYKPEPMLEVISAYLQDYLSQSDQQLREKIGAWLEGPQSFIGDLNQLRLSPAGASGTRDLKSGKKTLTPELSAEGNIGFFNFELQSTVKLNISIKQKPGDDQPICVVIFGRDKTNFTAAYPLETYGKEHLRAKTDALPIGQYVLCVPAMFTQE